MRAARPAGRIPPKKGCEDLRQAVSNQVSAPRTSTVRGPSGDLSEGASLMSQPVTPAVSPTATTTSTTARPATRDRHATDDGQITVAENVVQKIAGKACREIAGVHAMGSSGT